MTKEDLQAIAELLKPISDRLDKIENNQVIMQEDISNIKTGQTKLELKIENEIDRAIKTIGEGHLDLNRKLIEKISLDNRVETLEHKVSALEYVVEK